MMFSNFAFECQQVCKAAAMMSAHSYLSKEFCSQTQLNALLRYFKSSKIFVTFLITTKGDSIEGLRH